MSEIPNPQKSIFDSRTFDCQPESPIIEQDNSDDVDMTVLLELEEAQCAGEPDFIVELIDLYLENFPLQLSAMKDFMLRSDATGIKRAAHRLKGSSANLGVKRISGLCDEIERINFSDGFQPSDRLIHRLEESFARVHEIFLAERERKTRL